MTAAADVFEMANLLPSNRDEEEGAKGPWVLRKVSFVMGVSKHFSLAE